MRSAVAATLAVVCVVGGLDGKMRVAFVLAISAFFGASAL
jgi:hypothetical protein